MTLARVFVLAGDPVAHSMSPVMHAAAFRALGMPHTYEARGVDASAFPRLVLALRRGEIDGMNVTVPHKTLALALADVRDPVAEATGAANTLARDQTGRVRAINTDVPALEAELARMGACRGGHALVLGAGGAARAAIVALGKLGALRVTVRARDVARAAPLAKLAPNVSIEPLKVCTATDTTLSLIVQATSAGMIGADPGEEVARAVAWEVVPSHALAYDVVYAPATTPFVAAARARGLVAESGLGMLVRQGALSFERWLGVPAPIREMRAAAVAEAIRRERRGV